MADPGLMGDLLSRRGPWRLVGLEASMMIQDLLEKARRHAIATDTSTRAAILNLIEAIQLLIEDEESA